MGRSRRRRVAGSGGAGSVVGEVVEHLSEKERYVCVCVCVCVCEITSQVKSSQTCSDRNCERRRTTLSTSRRCAPPARPLPPRLERPFSAEMATAARS